PTTPVFVQPQYVLFMHGDVDFTATERASINDAAKTWNTFSNNRVRIDITYDLDFKNTYNLKEHINDNLILKISETSYLVDGASVNAQGRVLAWVDHDPEWKWMPQKLYIVADRIEEGALYGVALHEFGHILWVEHIQDRYAVMNLKRYRDVNCLNKS